MKDIINYLFTDTTISWIIFIIFLWIIFSFIHKISTLISNHNELLIKKNERITLKNNSLQQIRKLSFQQRIDITNNTMNLINFLIQSETSYILQTYAMLNSKYNVIEMDEDIKKITEHVYNGIEPDVFTDENILLKDTYIMEYILNQSKLVFMATMQQYNQSFRLPAVSNDDGDN